MAPLSEHNRTIVVKMLLKVPVANRQEAFKVFAEGMGVTNDEIDNELLIFVNMITAECRRLQIQEIRYDVDLLRSSCRQQANIRILPHDVM